MMKLLLYLIVIPFVLFCIYVAIVNRHSKGLSIRQMVMKAVYPTYMWFSKKFSKADSVITNHSGKPVVSFYSLNDILISGQPFDFEHLKGKKVLLVNTASDCVYTPQYHDLEKLHERYPGKLVVIGFPSNEFNEQEKADDSSIASFCRMNFDVGFQLMRKSMLKKTAGQNEVYRWLTDSSKNGWNNKQPQWNFAKYLVNEEGNLVNYFGPSVSPLDKVILEAIEK